eukprot:3102132-Amphidinium_carterae.1
MLGKRVRFLPAENASPGKRLRGNLDDLLCSNSISTKRYASLLRDAEACGITACSSRGAHAKTPEFRTMVAEILRDSDWPSLQAFSVPLKTKGGAVQPGMVAFLLPHELLHKLVWACGKDALLESSGIGGTSYPPPQKK